MPITGSVHRRACHAASRFTATMRLLFLARTCRIAAAASAAAHGRKTILVERYGFLVEPGPPPASHILRPVRQRSMAISARSCHGADDLLARIDRLGGLNAPHVVLGKTKGLATTRPPTNCRRRSAHWAASISFSRFGVGVLRD